jgi:hypothetical protein
MLPKVSCICPTYSRPHADLWMLEECVYWFTAQDFVGEKELIILNDNPRQELVCNVPNVRVVNHHTRYDSLGAKYNALLELATGDVIFPWEDDDISLPHRISMGCRVLESYGVEYFNPKAAFFLNGPAPIGLCDVGSVHHNASCYKRNDYRYPETCKQDMEYDLILRARVKTRMHLPPEYMPAYVYRWGIANKFGNLSGYPDAIGAYRAYTPERCTAGTFNINPLSYRDYLTECKAVWGNRLPS